MIGSLKGMVAGLYDDRAIIEIGGVGYLVFLGSATLARLRQGEAVFLFTETYVREDALKLFGFFSDIERAWFVRLQEVSGVGAKVALAILDILTPSQIIQAVEIGDKAIVGRASGVGPKLAQRIVTELKGRPLPAGIYGGKSDPVTSPLNPPPEGDEITASRIDNAGDMNLRNNAISALQNLGIGQSDAMNAVAHAYQKFDSEPELNALVKQALKELKS